MPQKVLVSTASDSQIKLQPYLDDGWNVKFAIPESISVSKSHAGSHGAYVEKGKIVYIIEK